MDSAMNSCAATRRAFLLAAAGAAFLSVPSLTAQCGGPGKTCVTLRSGPDQGITALVGSPGAALKSTVFGPADFSAAAAGTELVEVTTPPGSWVPSLSDLSAKWIGLSSTGMTSSFLLSHPFVLDGCAFGNACIQIEFAADDMLGDPSPDPNTIGVYLNGNPVPGMSGVSGFSFATTWSATGIGSLLHSGCNTLELYVRDVHGSRSGAIYSATICYDDECLAEEHIVLHSGNGSGTTDSQVRLLPVIPGVPLTAANFAAACASATFATQTGAPSNACTNVGAGSWLMNPGYGTLYAHPFEIKACNITSLRIKGRGAVWGFLGDALGNPNVGIYVNGKPIRGSVAAGNGGTACLGGEVVIGGCDLVTGTNCIYFCLRDVVSPIAPMTGLVYDLQMTVRSCAQPEQIHFVSDTTVTQNAGPSSWPLKWTPFVWPVDFTSSTAAAVVASPRSVWCSSIGNGAVWLSNTTVAGPASILFNQTFQVATCTGSIGRATLTLNYAVDDHLGDKASFGPNAAGLYINGVPVNNSATISGGPGICRTMKRDITNLLVGGANVFSLYCRDTQGVVSGAIWDATIEITPCPRRAIVIGGGCVDTNASLDLTRPLQIGNIAQFDLDPASPSAIAAVLALGFGAIPPFDLTPLGAPGCTIDIAFVVAPGQMVFGPIVSFPMAVPADPSLTGLEIYSQGLVLDPIANALGVVVTAALKSILEQ